MIIDAHAHVLNTDVIGELAHGRPFSDERIDGNYTYFVPGLAERSGKLAAILKVQT